MRLCSHSRACLIVAGIAASVVLSAQVIAHEGAMGIVKERMDYMKALGDNTKPLGAMFKGEVAYDQATAREHAAHLAEAAPQMLALFPEGSNDDPSEALPVIWEQWEDFQVKVADFETTSAALLETLDAGGDEGQVRAAFARMGKTCGNCHEVYREEKE